MTTDDVIRGLHKLRNRSRTEADAGVLDAAIALIEACCDQGTTVEDRGDAMVVRRPIERRMPSVETWEAAQAMARAEQPDRDTTSQSQPTPTATTAAPGDRP